MNFDTAVKAIQAGDHEALGDILEARPDLASGRNAQGVSLFMVAVYHRQPAAMGIIRARLKVLDAFEATAVGDLEQLQQRLDATPGSVDGWSPDGFNLVQLAAFFDQPGVLRELVKRGAELDQPSRDAMRIHAVNAAAASGAMDCMEILLRAGTNVNVTQQAGITALMSAAHRGDSAMCKLLLKHGADLAARDDDGRCAADHARQTGYQALANLLNA